MYLLLLTLGFIAISALGLLARYKIRPSLCRFLAAGLALAGFIAYPILDEQITAIPPPPQFNFHEADENASGPATLLQVFAVDMKGFVTAQEIPLREAQTLNIPLGVYGSIDLKVDPAKRSTTLFDRKTHLISVAREFSYWRGPNCLTREELDKQQAERDAGTAWVDIYQPLNERFFSSWQNINVVPLCQTKNSSVRISWRTIQPFPDQKTFDLKAMLAKYEATIVSKNLQAKILASSHLRAQDVGTAMDLILTSHRYALVILLAAFALFIALPLRLPLALPTASVVSLLFLLTLDNQNWRRTKLESDPIEAWRSEQHSLFFSQGEAEVTSFEKILQSPNTKFMPQVKP